MTTATKRKHPDHVLLAVDYPRQNEIITSPTYTIRVFAPEGIARVGISVDRGPWKSCREAVGYWWYDWAGYINGEHEVVVSMETPEGLRVIAEPHEFFVNLPKTR